MDEYNMQEFCILPPGGPSPREASQGANDEKKGMREQTRGEHSSSADELVVAVPRMVIEHPPVLVDDRRELGNSEEGVGGGGGQTVKNFRESDRKKKKKIAGGRFPSLPKHKNGFTQERTAAVKDARAPFRSWCGSSWP